MSGLCPFAIHKIIAPGSSDPRIKPRVAILHVDAGNAFSLEDFFRHRSGGIESHFHVRNDGAVEQYRDIYYQADANHHANDFAISIETQGYGAGEWNEAQLGGIKRLLVWLNDEAGIPLRKCPAWNGSGVGYHIQFGSPGAWTPVAKSCPGPDRIKQFHNVLVPWMNGNPTAPEGDDDMLTEKQHKALMEVLRISRRSANREMKMNGALRDVLAGLSDLKESTADDATRKQARDLWRRLGDVLDELAKDEAADEESGEGDASPRP